MSAFSNRSGSFGWARFLADANIVCRRFGFGLVEFMGGVVCLLNNGTPSLGSQSERILELCFPYQPRLFLIMDGNCAKESLTEEHDESLVANFVADVPFSLLQQRHRRHATQRGV
jgi:hypothetical protein